MSKQKSKGDFITDFCTPRPRKKEPCRHCGKSIPLGIGAYNLTTLGFGKDLDGYDQWSCVPCVKSYYRPNFPHKFKDENPYKVD